MTMRLSCIVMEIWRLKSQTDARKHGRTDAQVILYSIKMLCNALDGQKQPKRELRSTAEGVSAVV